MPFNYIYDFFLTEVLYIFINPHINHFSLLFLSYLYYNSINVHFLKNRILRNSSLWVLFFYYEVGDIVLLFFKIVNQLFCYHLLNKQFFPVKIMITFFFLAAPCSMRYLNSQPMIQPTALQWKCRVLTIGNPAEW